MEFIEGEKYRCISREWVNFTKGNIYLCDKQNYLINDNYRPELIREYFDNFELVTKEKINIMKFEKGKKYVSREDFVMENNFISFKKNKSYDCAEDGYLNSSIHQFHSMLGYEESFYELLTSTTQKHYDNTNGSLYQFCEDKQLNSYEFDIIKRVMRCRKKGLFLEDLEKTKVLIDLYIKEHNEI
jgi:hypothetical protein